MCRAFGGSLFPPGGGRCRLPVSRDASWRHLYDARVASAHSVDPRGAATHRIDRVLTDLVKPSDYVGWEYFSRQRLLATGVVASRVGPPARILDIGCGFGALSLTLSESAGFDVVAMDILESRVSSVAAKKAARDPAAAARIRILRADAQALPFRDGVFDAVVATEVLEHLDDPERLWREASRVLRPHGRFFMTTPNAKALPYRILRFLPDAAVRKLAASLTAPGLHPELRHDHRSAEGGGHPDEHRREGFTLREVKTLASHAGLRMDVAYTYRIPVPDRVMGMTPRRISRSLASLGTHPLPLGLQVYAEFTKP